MDHIVLVRPSVKGRSGSLADDKATAPLGILAIASVLKSKGYAVRILDQMVNSNFTQELIKEVNLRPLCIGISSITGYQVRNGLECAKIIKKLNSDIPVILGGVHATILPEQAVESEFIDIAVMGEGEMVMLKLVESFISKKDIRHIDGIAYKHEGKVYVNSKADLLDLSTLPMLDYTLLDMERYIDRSLYFEGGLRTFSLNLGRGCGFRCRFCYNTFMGKKHRCFPIKYIIDNIRTLNSEYNVQALLFIDDYLFANLEAVKSVCEGLIESGLDVVWSGNTRVNTFLSYDRPLFDMLKKGGCRSLHFGIESGSQRMLDFVCKDISVSQIKALRPILQREGFCAYFSFIFGLPTENRNDFIETLKIIDYLGKYRKKVLLELNCYVPCPGTELFNYVVEHKMFNPPQTIEGWATLDRDANHLNSLDRRYTEIFLAAQTLAHWKLGGLLSQIKYSVFYNLFILLKADFILLALGKLVYAWGGIKSRLINTGEKEEF